MKKIALTMLILWLSGLIAPSLASESSFQSHYLSAHSGTHQLNPHSAHQDSSETSLLVTNATVRPLLPGKSITAAFLHISNHGDKDCQLKGVDSPMAARIEFHTHHHEQGMVKMRPVKTLDLAVGDTLVFKSGGLHLMLFGVSSDIKTQNSMQISIHTDQCGSISFPAIVMHSSSTMRGEMHH
jgi:copper(I)-binding protein